MTPSNCPITSELDHAMGPGEKNSAANKLKLGNQDPNEDVEPEGVVGNGDKTYRCHSVGTEGAHIVKPRRDAAVEANGVQGPKTPRKG